MYVTLKNGKRLRMPTDEEDAAITAAAMSDPDALPLTDEELAQFRPAKEVFSPEVYAAWADKSRRVIIEHVTDAEDAARQAAKRGGRPRIEMPRQTLNMRVDAQVLQYLRATGKGWQTRVNALLSEAVASGRL